MNQKQRYLFDLKGYLVVENVLNQEQLELLNQAINKQKVEGGRIHGLLNWKEDIFRELMVLPTLRPLLSEILGKYYRLDHEYGLIHQKGEGELHLHGGGTPYDPSQYYIFRHNQIYSGLTVVSFALTDVGAGDGGFCCIPGSHKSNYPFLDEYKHFEDRSEIVQVPQKAGDVLIFTEALTHGTLKWQAEHERRSLLYKYSPADMAWAKNNRSQELKDKLTEEQKEMISEPCHPYIRSREMY